MNRPFLLSVASLLLLTTVACVPSDGQSAAELHASDAATRESDVAEVPPGEPILTADDRSLDYLKQLNAQLNGTR